jgi:PI31 proteasome regulator N-terminal
MTKSSDSALGVEKLLDLTVKSLPAKASDESSPVVKDAYAAIGLFAHACMLAVGFRLVGLGEDHKISTCNTMGLSTRIKSSQMPRQIRKMSTGCLPSGTLRRHTLSDMLMHNHRWNI